MEAKATGGFRADVQGLRAVAVLLVVIYHANLGLDGGFIGVDVFFVISGFVIGRSLVSELDRTGRVDLWNFYAKRLRRLLPALALVTVVTLAVSILLLGFSIQGVAADTARAATLFHANIFLYQKGGGYFAASEELNPFLHTWSLSVEEQFYFVLPGTLALLWYVGRSAPRKLAAVVLGLGGIVSFLLCWSLTSDVGFAAERIEAAPRAAFYLPITRIWEFLAGVALALWPMLLRAKAAKAVGTLGLAMIVGAAVVYDESTLFPGVAAAVPVLGTVAVIVAGGQTVGSGLLERRPLTWIGDISYSWYLWHWPAIVLSGQLFPTTSWAPQVAAVASVAPAWLSYAYVENRIRFSLGPRARVTIAVAASALLAPLGASALLGAVADANEDTETAQNTDSYQLGCHILSDVLIPWNAEACTWSPITTSSNGGADTNRTRDVFLVGDSHAGAVADAVREAALFNDMAFKTWSISACPFALAPTENGGDCGRWQEAALELVIQERPSLVVIANRSTWYALAPFGPRTKPLRAPDGTFPTTESDALVIWEDALRRPIDQLTTAGIPVLILNTVPEYEVDGPSLQSLVRPDGYIEERPWVEVEARRRGTVEIERQLAALIPGVDVLDPAPILCLDDCSPVRNDAWLYKDGDHLSIAGAALLVPAFSAAIAELAANELVAEDG